MKPEESSTQAVWKVQPRGCTRKYSKRRNWRGIEKSIGVNGPPCATFIDSGTYTPKTVCFIQFVSCKLSLMKYSQPVVILLIVRLMILSKSDGTFLIKSLCPINYLSQRLEAKTLVVVRNGFVEKYKCNRTKYEDERRCGKIIVVNF